MPAHQSIKLRHSFTKEYAGTWITQGVGAQTAAYRRGWYPQLPSLNGTALALCRVKKWLYVGGSFTTVGGVAIPYLFRMSLEDGVVDTTFNLALSAGVIGMATDGTSLYVVGSFTDVSGTGINYAMKLDGKGNLVTSWTPTPDLPVTDVVVRTGSEAVYLIGAFAACGGEVRDSLAEVSSVTGFATAFDAGAITGTVLCGAYNLAEDMLYIGGAFTAVAATGRNRLAKLAGSTGALESWDPDADDQVNTIAIDYPLVYVGGEFANVGGAARDFLACLNQAATATSWDPSPAALVNEISLDTSKDNVFYCGDFSGGAAGVSMAGVALPWTPGFDAACEAILFYKSTAFVGGAHTSFNGIGATTITQGGAGTVPFPLFRDDNTIFVKQTGAFEDAGAGTYAAPKRSLNGAIGTEPTFEDQSAANNDLTQQGVVQNQWESWCKPKGYWMAGLFNDSNYLLVPAAIGTAFAASNAFTVQVRFWIESLAAINTIWDWQNATGDVIVTVSTTGVLGFNIHGVTDNSAAGAVQARRWYTVTLEKNPSGNTKRAWLTEDGLDPVLVIDTTQAATLGANTSHRLAKNRASASQYLVGFLGHVQMHDAAVASTLGPLLDWRDSYGADCVGYWPMQTLSALEGDAGNYYVCILDSETYEEAFNWHVDGCSLYANDGCRPVFSPRVGAKPGTYGARATGREKFYAGAGDTFYVSKAGDDATGAANDPALPFLTIQAAITAAATGDCVEIQDSGVYVENLNSGADVITLQAADGEIPTLRQKLISTAMLQGALNIFGLILKNLLNDSITDAGSYEPTASVEIWDCTVIGLYMRLQDVAADYVIRNSTFGSVFRYAGHTSASSLDAKNCVFGTYSVLGLGGSQSVRVEKCTLNKTFNSATGAGVTSGALELYSYCKFTQALVIDSNATALTTAKLFVLFRCTLNAENLADVATLTLMDIDIADNGLSLSIYFVTGCLFMASDVGQQAYNLTEGELTAGSNIYVGISQSIFYGFGHATEGSAIEADVGLISVKKFLNLTSLVSGGVIGYNLDASGSEHVQGLVGNGATEDIVADAALTVDYSTFGVVGANVTGTGLAERDPLFLNDAAGVENLALSASSACLFTGDIDGIADQGSNWAWACNQVPGAVINGLRFTGPINMGAGLENVSGVATAAEFCTFAELGVAGYLMRDGASAHACEAAQTNGPGFRVGGVSASVTRCIAWGCAGTGFLYGAPDLLDEHNSSWGCERGHSDSGGAVGAFNDSIHSCNGLDAVANEQVVYSAVGTVGDDTEMASTSTQADPLFQEPTAGDLRLKALERGYAFTSPAKGTGQDGEDMGAYEAEYGLVHEPLIELDFGQVSSIPDAGNWLNPDTFFEELVPIRLTEGDKPSGSPYSSAQAYKSRWTLGWGENNPMPQDQLIALAEAYRASGRKQLVLDGACYEVEILRSNAFQFTEVGGAFVNTDMPKPLNSLVLQEV